MLIRTNKIFDTQISKRNYDFLRAKVELPEELARVISVFREIGDCVIVEEFLVSNFSTKPTSDFDKCMVEDNVNDIHVDNYIFDVIEEFEYLKLGLEVAKRLHDTLFDSFKRKFRIMLSYSETVYENGEVEIYGGCVLKFHTIRPSCDNAFESGDLDLFLSDAVVVLE